MTSQPAPEPSEGRAALIAGVSCYAIWGFIPLVFQQMDRLGAGPFEIMAHRMVWSVLFAALLVLAARQSRHFMQVVTNRRVMGWLVVSTILIAMNWTTYVYAVNNHRTLEGSLGYYLNPLLNMAAGAWLFKEKLSRAGLVAIGLAGIGVVLQGVALGHLPWISLVLAFSFCAYGIIRKRVDAEAQSGLLVECLLLMPPALFWIVWLAVHGQGHFGVSWDASLWLVFAGPVTVVPMALFAWAVRRMPYSTIGFLQFLAPSIVFVIGVMQGEPFGWLRGVSFVFIWAGAAVFAAGAVLKARATKVAAPEVGLDAPPDGAAGR